MCIPQFLGTILFSLMCSRENTQPSWIITHSSFIWPLISYCRQKGFRNLYTLSGGVSNYLKSEGSAGWIGNLFVFDARLSLPPSIYMPGVSDSAFAKPELVHENSAFARCYVCGSKLLEYRHRNCANPDCNRLFLLVPADPTCLVSKIRSAMPWLQSFSFQVV